MNSIFEFFLCPQHGLFRPDNLSVALAYGSSVLLEAQMLYVRLIAVFGRYL